MAGQTRTRKPATRTPPPPAQATRASTTERIAAALGLALTLGVIGYTVWEGVTDQAGPPELEVSSEAPVAMPGGFVVPIVVGNASDETAADVQVLGVLESPAGVVEVRRATFAYVPGRGEARGGLMFRRDPAAYRLRVEAEGYAEP